MDILVNGVPLLNKAGAVARGVGLYPATERKPVVGDSGFHGVVDETVPAECEVTITDRSDVMLGSLAAVNGDGTIIFRTRGGGKVYVMEGAYCVGSLEVTAGEGETSLKFFGEGWIEGVEG